jgi:HEPN domain-containing protein
MQPATTRQYQQEERSLIRARAKAERYRLRQLLDRMRVDELAPEDHVVELAGGLTKHYEDERFRDCTSMGELVEHSLRRLGWE